jgi:hypothetical protein
MSPVDAPPPDSRHLVPFVASVVGEGVASAVGGGVTAVVLLLTPANVTHGGLSGAVQAAVLAGIGLFWTVGLLAGRARVTVAQENAVPVPDPDSMARFGDDRRRDLRRGRLRHALLAVAVVVACGLGFHCLWVGLALPLIQVASAVAAWNMTGWERRHGVVLWKPALSAVGREAHRTAPFYTTPVHQQAGSAPRER